MNAPPPPPPPHPPPPATAPLAAAPIAGLAPSASLACTAAAMEWMAAAAAPSSDLAAGARATNGAQYPASTTPTGGADAVGTLGTHTSTMSTAVVARPDASPVARGLLSYSDLDYTFGYVKEVVPHVQTVVHLDFGNNRTAVLVSPTVANPSCMKEGQPVAFKVEAVAAGERAKVTGPFWRLAGKVETGSHVTWGPYIGKVRTVLREKGCAFVDCLEVANQFGRDAYVHADVMRECALAMGDTIRFDIHFGITGKPQVLSPVWKETTSVSTQAVVAAEVAAPAFPPAPAPPPPPAPSPAFRDAPWNSRPQTKVEELTFGFVRQTVPASGYTVVITDPSDENSAVYVRASVIDPSLLAQGQPVAFLAWQDGHGQTQVSKPFWRVVGSADPTALVTWGEFEGTIGAIDPSAGYYVVICPEAKTRFGQEPLIEARTMERASLQPGDRLRFDVAPGSVQVGVVVTLPVWKEAPSIPSQPAYAGQDYWRG